MPARFVEWLVDRLPPPKPEEYRPISRHPFAEPLPEEVEEWRQWYRETYMNGEDDEMFERDLAHGMKM